jgi:hypothetical protein
MKTAAGVLMVSGCLFFSSAAFAEEPKEPKEQKEQKVAAPAGESAGKTAPRMIVVKDPETGQLRAPTAAEIEALKTAAPAPKLAVSGQATTVEKLLSGRVRATLGPEYMRYSVVRKNPDGSLSEECVTPANLDAAVYAPATKASPAAKPATEEK